MKCKMVILDIDNTIYNWLDVYSYCFQEQVEYLHKKVGLEERAIKTSFKKVFKKYDSLEVPDAVLELSIWDQCSMNQEQIENIQRAVQNILMDGWRKNIKPYPNVRETLEWLRANSVYVVGLSDAFSFWIDYRLTCLSMRECFDRIYALENGRIMHSKVVKEAREASNVISISLHEMKPSTKIVEEVAELYKVDRSAIYLVGDSLKKDIAMAQSAQVHDIWAKYGTKFKRGNGSLLGEITPWRRRGGKSDESVKPSYMITDFSQLRNIIF